MRTGGRLKETGELAETYTVDDFHRRRTQRGGDPWKTDGKLFVGVIAR
jgi:hypothetical protein